MLVKSITIPEDAHPLAHSLAKQLWQEINRILERDETGCVPVQLSLIVLDGKTFMQCAAKAK